MLLADLHPAFFAAARQLPTSALFPYTTLFRSALPRGSGPGYSSGRVRWIAATIDANGSPRQSGCAARGCDVYECVVSMGYISALLRSECTSAPSPPPPVGSIAVGPDYVIMTVA